MITTYNLTENTIFFKDDTGQTIPVYMTSDSGRIVYRNKINTVFGVDHPGIILGDTTDGQTIIVHHHYQYGKPILHTLTKYADGEVVKYDERKVYYSQYEMVKRALALWWSGVNYNVFVSNCQHFVNRIATNTNYSESIDRGSDKAMALGALAFLAGLFLKNKTLMQIGGATMAGGGGAKIINRL